MPPETVDTAATDLIERVLHLSEGDRIQMDIGGGLYDDYPDYYDEDRTYEVRKTAVKYNKRGHESYYNVFLYDPHAGRTADPLFKITVCRNVPGKKSAKHPDNPEWTRMWCGHKGYNDWGNWKSRGTRDVKEVTLVTEVTTCPTCGQRTN